ncbi:MAG: hypothetical protein WC436_04100 [Candidatus Babeliales bacterium]
MIKLLKFKKIFLLILFSSPFIINSMNDDYDDYAREFNRLCLPPQMSIYNPQDHIDIRMSSLCHWAEVLNEKLSRILFTFELNYPNDHPNKIACDQAGRLYFQISKYFLQLKKLFINNYKQKNVNIVICSCYIEKLIAFTKSITKNYNFDQIILSTLAERENFFQQKPIYQIYGPPEICCLLRRDSQLFFNAAKIVNDKIFGLLKIYYCQNHFYTPISRSIEMVNEFDKPSRFIFYPSSIQDFYIFDINLLLNFIECESQIQNTHQKKFIETALNSAAKKRQSLINIVRNVKQKQSNEIFNSAYTDALKEQQKIIKYYKQALELHNQEKMQDLQRNCDKKLRDLNLDLCKQRNIATKNILREAQQKRNECFTNTRENLKVERSEIFSNENINLRAEQEKILALEKQRLLIEQERCLREQQEQYDLEKVRQNVEDLSIQKSQVCDTENPQTIPEIQTVGMQTSSTSESINPGTSTKNIEHQPQVLFSEDFVLISNIFGQIYKTNNKIVKLINQAKKYLAHDSSLIDLLTKMRIDNKNLTSNRSLENGFKTCIIDTNSLKFFTCILRVIGSLDSNALHCKNKSRPEQIEFLKFFKESIIQKCGHIWLTNYTNLRNELINLGKELLEAIKTKLPPDYNSALIMNNFERAQANLFDLLQIPVSAAPSRSWCTIS